MIRVTEEFIRGRDFGKTIAEMLEVIPPVRVVEGQPDEPEPLVARLNALWSELAKKSKPSEFELFAFWGRLGEALESALVINVGARAPRSEPWVETVSALWYGPPEEEQEEENPAIGQG